MGRHDLVDHGTQQLDDVLGPMSGCGAFRGLQASSGVDREPCALAHQALDVGPLTTGGHRLRDVSGGGSAGPRRQSRPAHPGDQQVRRTHGGVVDLDQPGLRELVDRRAPPEVPGRPPGGGQQVQRAPGLVPDLLETRVDQLVEDR